MSAGSLTSSGDAAQASAYGLAGGQGNQGYSSSAGSTGFDAVSRPLDVASGTTESTSAGFLRLFMPALGFINFLKFLHFCIQHSLCVFSTSLVHIGAADGGILHNSESESVNAAFTPAATELYAADSTEPVKVRILVRTSLPAVWKLSFFNS